MGETINRQRMDGTFLLSGRRENATGLSFCNFQVIGGIDVDCAAERQVIAKEAGAIKRLYSHKRLNLGPIQSPVAGIVPLKGG